MREQGQRVLSVVNVPESTMARESEVVLETIAVPEVGVAPLGAAVREDRAQPARGGGTRRAGDRVQRRARGGEMKA